MASAYNGDVDDLTTCCVCFNNFDDKERKPKFLPCKGLHTVCLVCVQVLITMNYNNFSCPICKEKCSAPNSDPELLQTNRYALNTVLAIERALQAAFVAGHRLCFTCQAVPKTSCEADGHSIGNNEVDKENIFAKQRKAAVLIKAVADNRDQADKHLINQVKVLEETLKNAQTKMEINRESIKQLDAMKDKCQQLKRRSQAAGSAKDSAFSAIEKSMEKILKTILEEEKDSKALLLSLGLVSPPTTEQASPSVQVQTVTDEPVATNDRFSSEMLLPTPSMYSRDIVENKEIRAFEFSDDGNLFVSGCTVGGVRVVQMDHFISGNPTITLMERKTLSSISSLAITPDSKQILSGCKNGSILVYDVSTTQSIHFIDIPVSANMHNYDNGVVRSISLQPDTNGSIFSSVHKEGTLRIYDMRTTGSKPNIQIITCQDGYDYFKAKFSPKKSTDLAVSEYITGGSFFKKGVKVIDIRNPSSFVYFPITSRVESSCFNKNGTQLLCKGMADSLIIHNCETLLQSEVKTPIYTTPSDSVQLLTGWDDFCFAGQNDEFVAASSVTDFSLHLWGVPSDESAIAKPLIALGGHSNQITGVRYNRKYGCLASSSLDDSVKIWMPGQDPGPSLE